MAVGGCARSGRQDPVYLKRFVSTSISDGNRYRPSAPFSIIERTSSEGDSALRPKPVVAPIGFHAQR
jgi:hypothetical protein